jgi:DNA-binding NarL/FixJ family response regulator
MNRPRVLLVDDHRMVVEGMRSLLAEEFDLVGTAEDGRAMIVQAKKLNPDIIVADIAMPHLNGIEALVQLRKTTPGVKVIFLTMHSEVAYARRAIEAGASGYVLKHGAPSELILAIRTALSGRVYITPAVAGDILVAMQTRPQHVGKTEATLTPRQREILQLLVKGGSAKEIANSLQISPRTVEFHKYQMMEALHIHNNAELMLYAVKNGLVSV